MAGAVAPGDVHEPIGAGFATDGIDELFHVFTRSRGKQVLEGPIRVSTVDAGASWVVALTEKPGRVEFVADAVEAAATMSGQAEHLLLALWKRRTLDEAQVDVAGSEETVRKFVAGPVTP